MPELLTPQKTERGWVIQMTPEMSKDAGVATGSYIVLYLSDGRVSAEILPPATEEMKRSVQESVDKFKDAFSELKRLGD